MLHIMVKDDDEDAATEESHSYHDWNTPGRVKEVERLFADFNEAKKVYLSHVEDCFVWRMATVPRLPTWRSETGCIVLIGDAAHAMLPYAAQGLSRGVESAVTLAGLTGKSDVTGNNNDNKDIPSLTRHFEEVRRPRVDKFVAMSAAIVKDQTLPDGPDQEARDAKLRQASQAQLAIK